MFTSLEESEFENFKVEPSHSSAPNLSVDQKQNKGSSRSTSRSPSRKLSAEDGKSGRRSKSPSNERPLLKNIAKSPSFDESSELNTDTDQQGSTVAEADNDAVVFRKTGVN